MFKAYYWLFSSQSIRAVLPGTLTYTCQLILFTNTQRVDILLRKAKSDLPVQLPVVQAYKYCWHINEEQGQRPSLDHPTVGIIHQTVSSKHIHFKSRHSFKIQIDFVNYLNCLIFHILVLFRKSSCRTFEKNTGIFLQLSYKILPNLGSASQVMVT